MKMILIGLMLINGAKAASMDLPVRDVHSELATESLLSRRGTLETPTQVVDAHELNRMFFSEMAEQNADMKKVKYYLLNGETRLAQVHLTKLAYTQTKLKPVIFRYLGILAFIEGRFQKSLEYLSLKELNMVSHYSKICTLKVLDQIVLNKLTALEQEWGKCQVVIYKHLNPENFVWLETLVNMKLKPSVGVTKAPFKGKNLESMGNDELKMFLKLSLYLNQEKLIEPQITKLDLSQVEDPEVRELVGQLYFRLGYLAKSYKFIDGLSSPNAENMKGNLYILRNKYELAYAQFKLALEHKANSQNAMERLLPLAWLLGDWEEGAKISERVIASPQTQINKMTLVAAFYTMKGEYDKADNVLESINTRSRRGGEVDVTQLHSFVALMQNKIPLVKKQASASCDQFDMVNCWLGLQIGQWDSFPLLLRRTDRTPASKQWEKLSQEEFSEPLTETVYVNQIDIEELDDKLIKLTPNAQP